MIQILSEILSLPWINRFIDLDGIEINILTGRDNDSIVNIFEILLGKQNGRYLICSEYVLIHGRLGYQLST